MAAPQQNPIELPPASAVPRPLNPQNPPNDDDFYAAIQYQESVRTSLGQELVNSTVLREAHTYTDKIHARITQGENAAPLWATEMFGQLHARFDDLDNLLYEYAVEAGERFGRLEERFGRLEERFNGVEILSAKAHNMTAADGRAISFQEVRFPNGNLPSEHVGLPILMSITVINGLTGTQCTEYCQLYYPAAIVPQALIRRKKKICRAIGCQQEPM